MWDTNADRDNNMREAGRKGAQALLLGYPMARVAVGLADLLPNQ